MTKIRRPESLGFRAGVRQRGRRRDGDTEARVRFCRQMLGRQWLPRLSSIIFSDEKLCNAYVGRCWSWCRGGELAPSRQLDRWGPAVHVWGAVGMNFKLLVFIDEKISSGVYVRRCLQALAESQALRDNRIFQQDNARPHVGPEARRWFRSHQVELLPNWPPRSPDLSPIENVWSIIQGEVDRRAPLNVEDVKKFWMQEWERIPMSVVNKLVRSFQERLQRCVKFGGKALTHATKKKRARLGIGWVTKSRTPP